MNKKTDELLSSIERLSVREKQVLALHLVQQLNIKSTSFVMGINEEEVKNHIDEILMDLYIPFGVYFDNKEAIIEDEKIMLNLLYEFLKDKQESDYVSKEEINKNYEYYVDKFAESREKKILENKKKGKRERKLLDFNSEVRNVLKSWWQWEMYAPNSLEETDLVEYRTRIDEVIEKLKEETFLKIAIKEAADVLEETLGKFPYYYVQSFSIDEISNLLGVNRNTVIDQFERMRKRVEYVLGTDYKLENITYNEDDEYLPNDNRLKNIIKVKMCELEKVSIPEKLTNEILVVYRERNVV